MKQVLAFVKNAYAQVVALVKKYPARATSYVVAAVVFVAAKFGVVLPTESVTSVIVAVVGILGAGEVTHHTVTPAK